jgi:small-conductance mechanosensitive channel
MDVVLSWLRNLVPLSVALLLVVLGLAGARHVLDRASRGSSNRKFRNQLVMAGLTLVGLIVVVLNLPIDASMKSQLLSLLGLVLSAGIALSSTNFLGNAMAGLMLRAVRNFSTGDFIGIGEHFGRVSERGLFHTEIQTEDRDLTTLPNLYLVTNPVRVIRSTGTIVSATVSLGYDAPRTGVESSLTQAAEEVGLQEPFVQVRDLGDFSVTYRVAGLLSEVKQLVSVRSALRKASMDALHGAGIEIVSPTFMTTRTLAADQSVIPVASSRTARDASPPRSEAPEAVMFDKADEAEELELRQQRLVALTERLEKARADRDAAAGEERERIERTVQRLEAHHTALESEIEARLKLMSNFDDG